MDGRKLTWHSPEVCACPPRCPIPLRYSRPVCLKRAAPASGSQGSSFSLRSLCPPLRPGLKGCVSPEPRWMAGALKTQQPPPLRLPIQPLRRFPSLEPLVPLFLFAAPPGWPASPQGCLPWASNPWPLKGEPGACRGPGLEAALEEALEERPTGLSLLAS